VGHVTWSIGHVVDISQVKLLLADNNKL